VEIGTCRVEHDKIVGQLNPSLEPLLGLDPRTVSSKTYGADLEDPGHDVRGIGHEPGCRFDVNRHDPPRSSILCARLVGLEIFPNDPKIVPDQRDPVASSCNKAICLRRSQARPTLSKTNEQVSGLEAVRTRSGKHCDEMCNTLLHWWRLYEWSVTAQSPDSGPLWTVEYWWLG
jgi:hypothetical protein